MQSVQDIALAIVAREGGYVNDPADPGGPTNYGVTLATMQRLGMDLTGDGQVTDADVQRLSRDQAVQIFVTNYYQQPHIDLLPEILQPSVFDMNVNAGATSITLLQRLVSQMGFGCTVDGVVGPQTAGAVRNATAAAPDHIVDAYGIARRNYYYALADAHPAMRKYARTQSGGKGGWITRAEEFISPKYRLTLAQAQERTKAWG